jgi:hypothetical protein
MFLKYENPLPIKDFLQLYDKKTKQQLQYEFKTIRMLTETQEHFLNCVGEDPAYA